jgi:hypothetical protein
LLLLTSHENKEDEGNEKDSVELIEEMSPDALENVR